MYERYVLLRDNARITDYRVAEDTGITKSTFSDWKSGRSSPKVDKLKKIADYFGVSLEYFLEDDLNKTEVEKDVDHKEETQLSK